ncbi:hypothetical protein [uncultured Erythrobacter sp.]|uniref:hypothetical protein n=1 Tax=uncultured Erythrobacter sp. TaxID=263913 RepID=UPI00260B2A11|nr:hypothetical protein [uncultured Erythrobacter sp.]
MKKLILIAPALLLAACGDEVTEEPTATETGGEVAGDVLEGSISDDMLPLEELTSTSPPAERTTTVTTTSNGSTTTVETTVTSSSDGAEAPEPATPAPPEPPAAPEQ